jgi:hypothetical protein
METHRRRSGIDISQSKWSKVDAGANYTAPVIPPEFHLSFSR